MSLSYLWCLYRLVYDTALPVSRSQTQNGMATWHSLILASAWHTVRAVIHELDISVKKTAALHLAAVTAPKEVVLKEFMHLLRTLCYADDRSRRLARHCFSTVLWILTVYDGQLNGSEDWCCSLNQFMCWFDGEKLTHELSTSLDRN